MPPRREFLASWDDCLVEIRQEEANCAGTWPTCHDNSSPSTCWQTACIQWPCDILNLICSIQYQFDSIVAQEIVLIYSEKQIKKTFNKYHKITKYKEETVDNLGRDCKGFMYSERHGIQSKIQVHFLQSFFLFLLSNFPWAVLRLFQESTINASGMKIHKIFMNTK